MNKFLYFILHNKEYRRIRKEYLNIFRKYRKAYRYWIHKTLHGEDNLYKKFDYDSIEYKKFVLSNINDIISIDEKFKKANQISEKLKKEAPLGYVRFIKELTKPHNYPCWYFWLKWCEDAELAKNRYSSSYLNLPDFIHEAFIEEKNKQHFTSEDILEDPYRYLFYTSNIKVKWEPYTYNFYKNTSPDNIFKDCDFYFIFLQEFSSNEYIDFKDFINDIILSYEKTILKYHKSEKTFDSLLINHKEAVLYFLGSKNETFYYSDVDKVERNQKEILEISTLFSKAKSLKIKYPKGFELLYGELEEFHKCTIQELQDLVDSEDSIRNLQNDFENKIKSNLTNKVSRWMRLGGSMPFYHMFNYFPKRFTEISDSSKRIREAIWRFKDGIETAPWVEYLHKVLSDVFTDEELQVMTFVPVPASSIRSNNKRYKSFAQKVSESIGLDNGFNHITLSGSRNAKHLNEGHTGEGDYALTLDNEYFKDRCVVLFDDIVTSGSSMLQMKELLEEAGAQVICAVSLGKTFSQGANASLPHPYDGDCKFY